MRAPSPFAKKIARATSLRPSLVQSYIDVAIEAGAQATALGYSIGSLILLFFIKPRFLATTVANVGALIHFSGMAPTLTDPLVEWMSSHETAPVELASFSVLLLLFFYRPRLVVLVCLVTTMIIFRGRPEKWLTALWQVTRRGKPGDAPDKLVFDTIASAAVAAVAVALVVGGTFTSLAPKSAFTMFASALASGHLAFVFKLVLVERGQSVSAYSAATLDDAQRREKIEIEAKREQIQAMMKEQTPEQVDSPEELPPNQPATVTVTQPPNARVVVGQALPATIQQVDGHPTGGNGEVQPMPVDAKAVGIEDGSLTIEVKVGVPLRGGSQLDDETLFDPLHYGKRNVVVDVGGKLVQMSADFVPPPEVRPNAIFRPTDAIKGGPVAVDLSMTMHLNLGEGVWVEISGEEDDNGDLAFMLKEQILPEGTVIVAYEIQVSGYVSTSGRFVCHNKMMNENARDVPMSPPVIMPTRAARAGTVENLRVVLKWGEHPEDLDLHCATSKPVPITEDGKTSNHMYHSHAQANEDISGEMRLDKDDTSGCGHETLTLDKLRTDVAYWFGVLHYSGEGNLATSEATIEVYGLTSALLSKAGYAHANATSFKIVVPRTEVEGCGKKGVWSCFGLTPNGIGGFDLTVVNKLIPHEDPDESDDAKPSLYFPSGIGPKKEHGTYFKEDDEYGDDDE